MGLPLVSGWGILTFAFPLKVNLDNCEEKKSPATWEFPAFPAPQPLPLGGGNQNPPSSKLVTEDKFLDSGHILSTGFWVVERTPEWGRARIGWWAQRPPLRSPTLSLALFTSVLQPSEVSPSERAG